MDEKSPTGSPVQGRHSSAHSQKQLLDISQKPGPCREPPAADLTGQGAFKAGDRGRPPILPLKALGGLQTSGGPWRPLEAPFQKREDDLFEVGIEGVA